MCSGLGCLHLPSCGLWKELTSIFWASSEGLKLDLMTTLTSSLVRPTSLTRGITRNGRMMSLVVRYLQEWAWQNSSCQKMSFKICVSVNPRLSHSVLKTTNLFKDRPVVSLNFLTTTTSFKGYQKSIYWPHELILSIRGDEADATLWVKLTEAHTLMESAVIDGYGLLPTAGRKTHKRHIQNRQRNISSLVYLKL